MPPRNPKPSAKPSRRQGGDYYEEASYLVDWYFGAARNALSLAGTETDVGSRKLIHRVSAVFFAAAALEAWLAEMSDEMFDGTRGGMSDASGALKTLGKLNIRWPEKLAIYGWLWSSESDGYFPVSSHV